MEGAIFGELFTCRYLTGKINLILTWSDKCVLSNDTKATIFVITDTTFLTQNKAKLLQQLKWGFKLTINWNKYYSKLTMQAPVTCLDYLIDQRI